MLGAGLAAGFVLLWGVVNWLRSVAPTPPTLTQPHPKAIPKPQLKQPHVQYSCMVDQ